MAEPRNHAPWCSFAHDGSCPAENEAAAMRRGEIPMPPAPSGEAPCAASTSEKWVVFVCARSGVPMHVTGDPSEYAEECCPCGGLLWPVSVVVEADVDRLRKIEEAARWVRVNWDREATQHLSMPALREALDGRPGAPTRTEVLATNIVEENTQLRTAALELRTALDDLVAVARPVLEPRPDRLVSPTMQTARDVLARYPLSSERSEV